MTADLTELRLGSLVLTPSFSPEVTSYTAATKNATNAVTAVPADERAAVTLRLNGKEVSSPVTWADGKNTLTVEIINGAASNTYAVSVTKTGV